MDDIFTCDCGNQTWIVNALSLECVKCGNKYIMGIGDIISVENFQSTRYWRLIKDKKEDGE